MVRITGGGGTTVAQGELVVKQITCGADPPVQYSTVQYSIVLYARNTVSFFVDDPIFENP